MEKKPVPILNQDFDLQLFLYITRKNLIWIVTVLLVSAFASFLYLRYTTPLYESYAIIQLTDDNESLDLLNREEKFQQNNIAQELELLRSPVFLQRMLDSLPLEVTYFNRGRILDYDNYANGPYKVEVSVINPVIYHLPVNIRFTSLTDYTLSYSIGQQKFEYQFVVNKEETTDHFTIRTLIRDENGISNPRNDYYFRINNPAGLVDQYARRLQITVLNDAAKTIRINNADVNYNRASDVVNGIAREFRHFNLEKKRESVDLMIDYIDKTLGIVRYRLNEADSSLTAFKKEHRLMDEEVDLDPLENKNMDLIRQYENRKFEYEIQLLVLEDVIRNVSQPEINIYEILTQISQINIEGHVSNIVSNLNNLIMRRDELRQQVTENSREMKEVNSQIETQKKLLLQSLNSIRTSYQSKVTELGNRVSETERLLFSESGVVPNEIELVQRKRMYEVNQKYYDELISKKAEYTLAREGYTPGYRILKFSSPNMVAVSPKKTLILGGTLAIWLVISLVIIAMKYLFHDKILTLADISRYSNAPILGIVAKYKSHVPISQLIVDKKPKSMMAETFRTIRSNLDFISNEPGSKLISVTSTISGEGKTFVSINMAGILAFTGKSVVVIDADMRKPKIHIGFNSTNEKGLSTLLIGKDQLEDCIRKSELEHLDFITAGPIPPNPSELLLGERMSGLIDELMKRYDYVLIDNPPIGIVTDAVTNMVKADYPVYVFRSDYSRRFFINNLERLIHENKISRLSVILNGVDLRKSNRYGYTYGYGGGYGYGYGNGYGYIHNSFGYYDEEGVISRRKFSLKRIFRRKND